VKLKSNIWILLFALTVSMPSFPQPVPAVDENIPYLVTFGADGSTSWGDDDFCQVFFCLIPMSQTGPVYIRIYDPDTGGSLDEIKGAANTITTFSVYGGKGCWSDSTAQSIHAAASRKSGFMLNTKSFGADLKYDKKWISLGPFNPSEGEFSEKLGGRVFKIIAQGISGDDGNLYRYFLSTSSVENKPVEGGNLFTYKYHFRMSDDQQHVCQIYPYVDDKTISIEILNFDWDYDGLIRVFSVAKNGLSCPVSGEDNWVVKKFPIVKEEKNTTIEIQFTKNKAIPVRNNNVAVAIRNQYGISLPFYSVPIGGIPVYSPKIGMKQ
jgi:hypothetical protein